MPGEPAPHYYFHRPLSKLLGEFFEAGFALDGMEEPQLDEDTQSASTLSWASVRDIPTIPGELFAKFQTSFYSDPIDAVFKALGVQ